jgi:hypothetical protein
MGEHPTIDPELVQRIRETLRCSEKLITQTRQLIRRSRLLMEDYALSDGRVAMSQRDSRPTRAK